MRQNNFDFLRFYFAFIVVIGHIIDISDLAIFQPYSPYFNTYTSVTAFFCISGFLIASSYTRNQSVTKYFKKRAARILPPYILIIVVCAVSLSLISQYSFSEYFTHPQFAKYLLANLSFLNFVTPCLPGVFTSERLTDCSVNGALWTLKIEVAFYVVVPLLFLLMKKINRKYIVLLIIYLLAVLYRTTLGQLAESTENGLLKILARQLPGFMSYFACGIALHYYFDIFIRYKKWFFAAGVILFAFEAFVDWEIFTPFALSTLVFSIAFSLKRLNNFGKYGDISYGIYIFHCPIIKMATDFGYFERYNPYVVACIIILIVLTAGFLSWHLLEKKFLKR